MDNQEKHHRCPLLLSSLLSIAWEGKHGNVSDRLEKDSATVGGFMLPESSNICGLLNVRADDWAEIAASCVQQQQEAFCCAASLGAL